MQALNQALIIIYSSNTYFIILNRYQGIAATGEITASDNTARINTSNTITHFIIKYMGMTIENDITALCLGKIS